MANWLTKLFGGKKNESQPDNTSEDKTQENVFQPEDKVENKEEDVMTPESETKEEESSEEERTENNQEGEKEERNW